MSVEIILSDVYDAWKSRDLSTTELFLQLVERNHQPEINSSQDENLGFYQFIRDINSYNFKGKSPEQKAHFRQQKIADLENEHTEYTLSERLKSHRFLLDLWKDNSTFSRRCLIKIIANVELCYGPWKGLKQIYKEAEKQNDMEIFGAISARIDREKTNNCGEINQVTIAYLCRRSWRYLRNLAKSFPVAYPDAAVNLLKHYPENINLSATWVADHVVLRVLSDHYGTLDLWRRTPRPLFTLLESAKADVIRKFAIELLKTEFGTTLRETEPSWVLRLSIINSPVIEEFIVWILQSTPKFEQSRYRELGFHEMVLGLLNSRSNKVVKYAVEYARAHARDLSTETLIELLGNASKLVSKLVFDLLAEKDPRKEIGLEGFSKIIATGKGYDFVHEAIIKYFGASELTPEWFSEQILSDSLANIKFATNHLFDFHKKEKLGAVFFCRLIDAIQKKESWWWDHDDIAENLHSTAEYALEQLSHFNPDSLDTAFIKRLFCWPLAGALLDDWVSNGKLRLTTLPCHFYKLLAYEPDWNQSQWIQDLKQEYGIIASQLTFNERLSKKVLDWMRDVRLFAPRDIGFDWLMKLLKEENPVYHDFASQLLLKSFAPEDFIEQDQITNGDKKILGCQRIWDYLLSDKKADSLRARFALKYFQHHHTRIGQEINGKPIDSGYEIPESFLTFDRINPLFAEKRKPLREFALQLSKWEFSRWAPTVDQIISLFALPHIEVRQFVADALFTTDKPEHRFYRLDTSKFEPISVYKFCESRVSEAIETGMMLIKRNHRFQIPEQLFFLTENQNRKVRAFAIKQLWMMYRDKGITLHWTPAKPPKTNAGMTRDQIGDQSGSYQTLTGAAKLDENAPSAGALRNLLRKRLFEIPRGRIQTNNAPEIATPNTEDQSVKHVRILSTRKAKMALIETLRDIAIDDPVFAEYIYPLFQEFTQSIGVSEQAACLVARTRIARAHPAIQSASAEGNST